MDTLVYYVLLPLREETYSANGLALFAYQVGYFLVSLLGAYAGAPLARTAGTPRTTPQK